MSPASEAARDDKSAPVGSDSSEPAPVSRLALPVILLAVFVMPIGISGTAVALPEIARDLGPDPMLLQGVVNGFNGAFAIFMLVWGVLSDRIGYKVTFVSGTALMVAGSAISAAAPSLVVLDLGRVICGIAGAAIFAGASATLSRAFSPAARGRNFAIFGATLGLRNGWAYARRLAYPDHRMVRCLSALWRGRRHRLLLQPPCAPPAETGEVHGPGPSTSPC